MHSVRRLCDRIEPISLIPGPTAPGWRIAVSRFDDGETVSGRGPTAEAATLSCLGEAAELLSARRREPDRRFPARDALSGSATLVEADAVTIADLACIEDPGTEGLGAGESLAEAELKAVLERIERHHAALWWTGRGHAERLSMGWLARAGLLGEIEAARRGAIEPRVTEALVIGRAGPASSVVAVSRRPDGRRPVLGIAAGLGAAEAARSAVSELFQMELALVIAEHVADHGDPGQHRAILDRAMALEGPMASLLDGPEAEPQPEAEPEDTPGAALEDAVRALGQPVLLVDLTRVDIGVPVARAHAPGLASTRRLKFTAKIAPM
ncbi:MAG: YcaO-like family protein [Pseudomonadota bacterium]